MRTGFCTCASKTVHDANHWQAGMIAVRRTLALVLFARYYVKSDRDGGEIHHFGTCLGGNQSPTAGSSVNVDHPTDGAKSFWSGIEPLGSSWVWDYYT